MYDWKSGKAENSTLWTTFPVRRDSKDSFFHVHRIIKSFPLAAERVSQPCIRPWLQRRDGEREETSKLFIPERKEGGERGNAAKKRPLRKQNVFGFTSHESLKCPFDSQTSAT